MSIESEVNLKAKGTDKVHAALAECIVVESNQFQSDLSDHPIQTHPDALAYPGFAKRDTHSWCRI